MAERAAHEYVERAQTQLDAAIEQAPAEEKQMLDALQRSLDFVRGRLKGEEVADE